jgi:hypothetical protein
MRERTGEFTHLIPNEEYMSGSRPTIHARKGREIRLPCLKAG